MRAVTITIHGPVPSKKNSKRVIRAHGRTLVLPSEAYEQWHKLAVMQLDGTKPIDGTVSVSITFYAGTLTKFDLTNKAESVMDTLVDCGIIADDNYTVVPIVTLIFGGLDRSNPRAEITITSAS